MVSVFYVRMYFYSTVFLTLLSASHPRSALRQVQAALPRAGGLGPGLRRPAAGHGREARAAVSARTAIWAPFRRYSSTQQSGHSSLAGGTLLTLQLPLFPLLRSI